MGSEPITFRLHKEGDFDGVTLMQLTRGDFTTQGGRLYAKNLTGPAGQINADFFGVFSDLTPKLVGIASSSWNPQSVARVISKDDPDVFREEVDLTPRMVHIAMYPGDRLAIHTQDGTRISIQLVVTELAESEHVELALRTPPEAQWRRFRLIRSGAGGFSHTPLANTYSPPFAWDPLLNMLVSATVGDGPIPARELCMYPKFQGCYFSVRYSGIAAPASLYVVDGHLREPIALQTDLDNGRWSKVQFLSHDDLVGLSSPAPGGGTVVCDLELVRVQPGDRLRGRYEQGL
jgi:hypothetical protein